MRIEKNRRADPLSSLLSPDEVRACRTMVVQIQWVGRETRRGVAGGASSQSAALPTPALDGTV
eukprot:1468142-Pyramimonas_sp.AAC.1